MSQALFKTQNKVPLDELIQSYYDNWAYRYYQYEKFTHQKLTGDTPVAKLFMFERLIKMDPEFKKKDD